ncbi:MAG: hypothetical protein JST64_07180 [Actinobacteria bacterium]|nr:hypothetical protein [Actinomycetota bacterium]
MSSEGEVPASTPRQAIAVVVAVSAVALVVIAIAVVAAVVMREPTRPGHPGATAPGAGLEVVSGRDAVDHSFVVPAGAAARTARGEDLGIVPGRLDVRVGDTIRIRNDDDVEAKVGIFTVAPHSTVTMRFTSAGRLEGSCDVHPSGQFVIDVAA